MFSSAIPPYRMIKTLHTPYTRKDGRSRPSPRTCTGSEKKSGVARIGIIGSYARGDPRQDSDVDVLVTFQKSQKTFEHYMDCKFYLEDLFGRKVDLVMEGAIKNQLKKTIFSEVLHA